MNSDQHASRTDSGTAKHDPEQQTTDGAERDALLEEMDSLRIRLGALDRQLAGANPQGQRANERHELRVNLRFLADFDVELAQGVNWSEGGMAIHIDDPIPLMVRYEQAGETITRNARLVRAVRHNDGSQRLGLEFFEPNHATEEF
ncbi:MAG: hypothetical protein ACI841_002130 [Planctomycetota bacterium]|jgi:hypothetical protein